MLKDEVEPTKKKSAKHLSLTIVKKEQYIDHIILKTSNIQK